MGRGCSLYFFVGKKSIFCVQPRKVDNGSLFGDVCQSIQLYKEDIQAIAFIAIKNCESVSL